MTAGVYLIRCVANGRVYVGSSVNIEKRFQRHKAALRRGRHHNDHLSHAWRKYGEEAFVLEVLHEVADEAERIGRETLEIAARAACDPAVGFNIAREAGRINRNTAPKSEEHRRKIAASNTGRSFDEETRRKISESQKHRLANPEAREAIAAAKRGKPLASEHKAKLREASLGKKHTAEAIARMSEIHKQRWADPVRGEELRAIFDATKRRSKRNPMSAQHKAAISRARKGHKMSGEARAKLSAIAKSRKPPEMTPARRALIAEAQRRAWARRKQSA